MQSTTNKANDAESENTSYHNTPKTALIRELERVKCRDSQVQ